MKVLIINGSPKENGNTGFALKEAAKALNDDGIETEIVTVGNMAIRGCTGCGGCYKTGKCIHNDIVNELNEKFKDADGLIVGSPVYYASANGTLISLLDRMFYSAHFSRAMKVGAAVAVARRGGTTATYDELNKYFGISSMPIVSSTYWNNAHGLRPGDAADDAEGLQTMRNLGHNMAFLIKSIALGREQFGIPRQEHGNTTNFIR